MNVVDVRRKSYDRRKAIPEVSYLQLVHDREEAVTKHYGEDGHIKLLLQQFLDFWLGELVRAEAGRREGHGEDTLKSVFLEGILDKD